jgi:hypothetical protein
MAGDPDSLDYTLDRIAISRSGLPASSVQNASVCHVSERAAFQNGAFSVSSGAVPKVHGVLYLARGSDIEYTGMAAESASRMNVPAMVYSSPFVMDVNVSLFASEFYSRMHRGMSCAEAFTATARGIMNQEKFSHPAYWAGMRLYLNGL